MTAIERAVEIPAAPDIETVRLLSARCSNWGRWGPDDQLGTLNHIRPEDVVAAAALVRTGRTFSLAIPVDDRGPQTGGFGRFNPIHLMIRDGNAAVTGTTVRDFYGGTDRHIRGTDDLLILPLQSGTQWDALAHIIFDGRIYNGYDATAVSSRGAIVDDIAVARDRIVGRGVLLDVPRAQGRDWLEAGEPIHAADLDAALAFSEALAPEHLQLAGAAAEALAPRVSRAGCLFVGGETGTAFGDYVAGSNHTLPTGGAARFASGLSARHFRRRMAEVRIGDAAAALARAGAPIARAEGFTAHAEAMEIRENPRA